MHDAPAFLNTCASRYPNWLFSGQEFAWTDSAYRLDYRTIPVHKKPAALLRKNAQFDMSVSHIRVRSEHCMGALKGRWQCLRGLRVAINSKHDHVYACQWITSAIILHNLAIEVEKGSLLDYFLSQHDLAEEADGADGGVLGSDVAATRDGERRRRELVEELAAHREAMFT